MTAAEARAFIAEHDLEETIAELVADAPPLPEAVADLLAGAHRAAARIAS